MKRYLVLLLLFTSILTMAQSRPKGVQTKEFLVQSDTLQIDSLSINPGFLEIYDAKGVEIEPAVYHVDFAMAKLWFLDSEKWKNKKIRIDYLPFPDFMTRNYGVFDRSLIVSQATDESQLYGSLANSGLKKNKPFDGLYTSGSLSRGVTIGSNQDAVVNSNFNLQIEGRLSDKVGIRASITDNEVPLQSGGFTQRLDEFDRVFIDNFHMVQLAPTALFRRLGCGIDNPLKGKLDVFGRHLTKALVKRDPFAQMESDLLAVRGHLPGFSQVGNNLPSAFLVFDQPVVKAVHNGQLSLDAGQPAGIHSIDVLPCGYFKFLFTYR